MDVVCPVLLPSYESRHATLGIYQKARRREAEPNIALAFPASNLPVSPPFSPTCGGPHGAPFGFLSKLLPEVLARPRELSERPLPTAHGPRRLGAAGSPKPRVCSVALLSLGGAAAKRITPVRRHARAWRPARPRLERGIQCSARSARRRTRIACTSARPNPTILRCAKGSSARVPSSPLVAGPCAEGRWLGPELRGPPRPIRHSNERSRASYWPLAARLRRMGEPLCSGFVIRVGRP